MGEARFWQRVKNKELSYKQERPSCRKSQLSLSLSQGTKGLGCGNVPCINVPPSDFVALLLLPSSQMPTLLHLPLLLLPQTFLVLLLLLL